MDIAIKMNPDRDWDPSAGDRYTDSYIDLVEWEQLFFNVLGAPHWEEYVHGEDICKYEDRQRTRFRAALIGEGYPLLSRIWRIFRDVSYYPHEIEGLREECIAVKNRTLDATVQQVLDRVISACDQAIDCGGGMNFVSH